MTLIYWAERSDHEPQTHILIIGCGRFSHLPRKVARQACADSAVHMADLFIEKAILPAGAGGRFEVPIGSVEMLLSDPSKEQGKDSYRRTGDRDPRAAGDQAVSAATLNYVKQATNDWLHRCDRAKGDHVLLYCCSHGVADGDTVGLLVLEDVKSNHWDEWEQLLNIRRMAMGISARLQPGASWFFVDACQELLLDILQVHEGVAGFSPVKATVADLVDYRRKGLPKPVVVGLGYGQKTFAPETGVAYLTEALTYGFRHCCFEFVRGEYVISGRKLVEGVADIADVQFGRIQDVSDWGMDSVHSRAHLFSAEDPKIPLVVYSHQSGKLNGRNPVRLKCNDGLVCERQLGDEGNRWLCSVAPPFGDYSLEIGDGDSILKNQVLLQAPVTRHEVYDD